MLLGQTQLFTLPSGTISLTSEAASRDTALRGSLQNQTVEIVTIADVRTIGAYDTVWFSLPGQSAQIAAEAIYIEDDSARFVWGAQLLNRVGSMSLSYDQQDGISGFLQIRDTFYDITHASGSYQFFVQRKNPDKPDCAAIDTTLSPPGPDPSCTDPTGFSDYNTCPALIYALVVISPTASDYILNQSGAGSIEAFIRKGQNQINQAFANSDIPNKQVLVKWIEKDYSECLTEDIYSDNQNIFSSCLAADWEDSHCDILIALTNENYSIGGLSSNIGPNAGFPFCIVEAPSYASSSFTFAHEVAHLLGARHNWNGNFGGDDDTEVCAHAYRSFYPPIPVVANGIYDVESWATIVAKEWNLQHNWLISIPLSSGGSYQVKFVKSIRLLAYSNPDEMTGTSWANNARTIRNVACTVADFYANQHLSVSVSESACRLLPYYLTANITAPEDGIPGISPYTVEWYWESSLLGTGDVLTIEHHPNCGMYWVKCIVTSTDGVVVTKLFKVDLRRGGCICVPPIDPEEEDERPAGVKDMPEQNLSIFPNPVSEDELMVVAPSLSSQNTHITVLDAQSRVVLLKSLVFGANGQASLDIKGLPTGLYLLQVGGNRSSVFSSKFIIQTR